MSLEVEVLLSRRLSMDEGNGELAFPAARATNRVALAGSVVAEARPSSDAVGPGSVTHGVEPHPEFAAPQAVGGDPVRLLTA